MGRPVGRFHVEDRAAGCQVLGPNSLSRRSFLTATVRNEVAVFQRLTTGHGGAFRMHAANVDGQFPIAGRAYWPGHGMPDRPE